MPHAGSKPLQLIIAACVLLPFDMVAKISLSLAALAFIFQPFATARLYAVCAVCVVLAQTIENPNFCA